MRLLMMLNACVTVHVSTISRCLYALTAPAGLTSTQVKQRKTKQRHWCRQRQWSAVSVNADVIKHPSIIHTTYPLRVGGWLEPIAAHIG